jgi:hypothetical protein
LRFKGGIHLHRVFLYLSAMKELFNPGRIHCSSGVQMEFASRNLDPLFFFIRHFNGDWGDVSPEECLENEKSLSSDGRLFSRYNASFGMLWIITTADRSETYMCFPDQYTAWATGKAEERESITSNLRQPPFNTPSDN